MNKLTPYSGKVISEIIKFISIVKNDKVLYINNIRSIKNQSCSNQVKLETTNIINVSNISNTTIGWYQFSFCIYRDNKDFVDFLTKVRELLYSIQYLDKNTTYISVEKLFQEELAKRRQKESNIEESKYIKDGIWATGSLSVPIKLITKVHKRESSRKFPHEIVYSLSKDQHEYYCGFKDESERDLCFSQLTEAMSKLSNNQDKEYSNKVLGDGPNCFITKQNNKEKLTMMETVKKYYKEHEDVLFPLLVVIVLDHFFNNGGLRERIVAMAQGLLDSVQSKLENKQLPSKE